VPIGRRLSTLLLALVLLGAPAVVFRAFCLGNSCDAEGAQAQAAVPFCPLPRAMRHEIAAGFRQGRSPDVVATVADDAGVWTLVGRTTRVPWPATSPQGVGTSLDGTRTPVVFFGEGIEPGAPLERVRLDAVAPTLEAITGFRRPHPEVRTGTAVEGVATARTEPIPLVVVIAWKGTGTADLDSAPGGLPFLRGALARGAGTLEARTGSLPLDPAAVLTTIGTGGLPSSHGITGTLVRDGGGTVRRAWSGPDGGSVIATFADDLDHGNGGSARVAAVVTDPTDRGIIGNGWYLDGRDRDIVERSGMGAGRPERLARRIVASEGLGTDQATDVLGVVLAGPVGRIDAETGRVVDAVRREVPKATFVVAGTGSLGERGTVDATSLTAGLDRAVGAPVTEAWAAGGLFLDRAELTERSITAQQAADALSGQRTAAGEPLFADVSPSFAVAFGKYC
jgi:hypothetical protein